MGELRQYDPYSIEPLEDMFRAFLRPMRRDLAEAAPQIRVDLSEHDGSYAIKADIPGVKKEDINVDVDGNVVTISAEVKKASEDKKDGRVLRSERQVGYASRTFTLAASVDESKAEAKYENGVLELRLPKKDASGNKRLAIK